MATIRGDNGNNVLRGTESIDRLLGLGGNDRLVGRGGNDTLIGGSGNDVIFGLLGNDLLRGGTGNDFLRGGDGNDTLRGEDGSDRIFGDDGNDRVFGGDGRDRIVGGDGVDVLRGQDGVDIMSGGDGLDRLEGGNDTDRLSGNDGNDRLFGQNGDDILIGGAGNDLIDGGAGDADRAIYSGNLADYTITETANGFIIDGPDGTDTVTGVEFFTFADGTVSAADLANEAPVAVDDTLTVGEGDGATMSDVLANDTDADGDTLTVVEVEGSASNVGMTITLASGATVLISSDGTATFNPNGGYESLNDGETATETISYTVSDGTDTATASFTVTITGVTGNNPPVVTGVEIDAIEGGVAVVNDETKLNALTEDAVVTDVEGNWDGGTIQVAMESGKFFGISGDDGNGLNDDFDFENPTPAAGTVAFTIASNSIIATPNGGTPIIIGTFVNDGSQDLEIPGTPPTAGDAVTTGFTITLNANATTDLVNKLLTQIRVEDAVSDDDGNALLNQGEVTVTITDGAGGSTSFTRLLDSDGATSIDDLEDDDREVEVTLATSGNLTIDDAVGSAAATLTDGGFVADGGVLTFASDISGDAISLDTAAFDVISGQLIRTGDSTIIGTVTGEGTNTVTVTLNSDATNGNIDTLLAQATITTTTDIGDHTVTVTATDAEGRTDSAEVVLGVVNDFTTITLASLRGATPGAGAVEIDGNRIVEIAGADSGQTADLAALVASGAIVITGGPHVIRLVTTANADISDISGFSSLGDHSFTAVNDDLTVDAAEVSGVTVTGDGTGDLTVVGLADTLDADMSGVDVDNLGVLTGAQMVLTAGATFTGNFGEVPTEVTGNFALMMTAAVANGADVNHTDAGGNANIVVTGLDGAAAYDISDLDTNGGKVQVEFASDATLDPDTDLSTPDLDATVAENATLTLTGEQATDAPAGSINGEDASGAGNTGGSIVVTDLEDGADLTSLSAGAAPGGGTPGTVSATIDADLTLTNGTLLGDAELTVLSGATLTSDADVVDGVTITGAGNVAVTNLQLDAAADLSNITVTGTKTANVAADVTFTGDLGDFSVSVDSDATFEAAVDIVDGKTIAGDDAEAGEDGGSVLITAIGTTMAGMPMAQLTSFDLSGITAGAIGMGNTAGTVTAQVNDNINLDASTNLGDAEVAIIGNHTLGVSVGQADGRTIDDGGNTGTVNVNLDGATNEDLSDVTVDDLNGTVSASINLSNVDLGGMSDITADDDDADTQTDIVVTMSANQADAINTANGGTEIVTIPGGSLNNNGMLDDDTVSVVVTAVTGAAAPVTYTGSEGDDTLAGTDLGDIISGGDGDDTISGGDGDDQLIGGLGADMLSGGAGEDNFIITAEGVGIAGDPPILTPPHDSGIGAGNRDVITDFEDAGIAGGDTIDLTSLSALNTDGAEFIGTGSFDADTDGGNTEMEVRYQTVGTDVVLEVDIDGDGAADLQIQIDDISSLSSEDILL